MPAGNMISNSINTPIVKNIEYMVNNVNPTGLFRWYFAIASTAYSNIIATNSDAIVYSMPKEFKTINDLSLVLWWMMLCISHGTPRDIKIASEFAPNEFETPIPLSP